MGSAWGSSCCMARSTARAARSWPAPARTWKMRTRFVRGVTGRRSRGSARGEPFSGAPEPPRRSPELPSPPGERVGDMLDDELRSIGPPGDPDHVEADRAVEEPATCEVYRGRLGHVFALLPAYRDQGRRAIGATP